MSFHPRQEVEPWCRFIPDRRRSLGVVSSWTGGGAWAWSHQRQEAEVSTTGGGACVSFHPRQEAEPRWRFFLDRMRGVDVLSPMTEGGAWVSSYS